MSTIIMSQCWPLGGMSAAQKAVLISLADQSNDDGVCWPSVGTIAKRTCLSERAVQEALQWLQATGAIFREYKTNSSTVYTVTPARFDPAKAPAARSRSKGADGAPPAPSAPPAGGAPGGADGAPLGVNLAHPTPAGGAPKSSLNRKGNHQGTVNLTAGGKTPTEEGEAKKSDEPKFMVINDAHGNEHHIPLELRYPGEQAKTHRAWTAYAIAYQKRYGVWPIWNASIGGRMSQLVDRVGQELAPKVAYHYVAKVEDPRVLKDMHSVALLLSGAEKWATQLRAGIKTPVAAPAAVNKQEALEARNRAVGEEWERKMRAKMAQNGG